MPSSSTIKDPEGGTHSTETTPLFVSSKDVSDDSVVLPQPHGHTIMEDVIDTIKLGVPIFIAMLSWVGVSRVGTQHEDPQKYGKMDGSSHSQLLPYVATT